MAIDAKALWEEVKERNRRKAACPRHFYRHRSGGYQIGTRVTCGYCGVDSSLREVGDYIRGYMAAGGDPMDVMPDWKAEG